MIVDDQANTRLSESVPDPLLGRTIDGYRIDEILGRGGMGVVYKATQLSLDRQMAVKLLPEDVTENRQFLDRFEREVDILARLSHPNIVTVFERGEVDGRPYIAMELVRGTSLRDVMRKGPLPPAEALLVVRSILSALEHAHEAGIVHRDIKPENVLVAPGGIVKVADFGLSRLMGDDLNTRLTKTHVALGTFEYMSPEQREMARDADGRSDLYATGVVLYEMIAGELPIGAFDRLSHKRPQECDARIDEVVEKSLKKSPDSRWPDARSMGDAVSRLLSAPAMQGHATSMPPPPPPPVQPPAEESTWKKVITSLVPVEYPVARIEKRLPRHFADRLIENIDVQRYLGRLVQLKSDFPSGITFGTSGGRLMFKMEGRSRIDAVQTKRLLAAYAVVLEANAPAGHVSRIAAADPRFEDAYRVQLANPPIVMREAAPRPDQIPDRSVLVSDGAIAREEPVMTGTALVWSLFGVAVPAVFFLIFFGAEAGFSVLRLAFFGLGVALVAILLAFVLHGERREKKTIAAGMTVEARGRGLGFGFAATALWVTIVLVLSDGAWQFEEIAWLCVGAMASVFFLPRLPDILKKIGAGAIVAIVLLLALLAVFMWSAVGDSMTEEARLEVERSAAAAQHDAVRSKTTRITFKPVLVARLSGAVPDGLVRELEENVEIRRWIQRALPLGDAPLVDIQVKGSDLYLTFKDKWDFDRARELWMNGPLTGPQANVQVEKQRAAIAAAYGRAAEMLAPGRAVRAAVTAEEWEKALDRSPPKLQALK
ncbi:MAG: serine/threonine-protein kinase [Planctomycetota bacterium]|jgi:serine/threonine protein kinase